MFWVYCLTREIFTHMETSPLPVKGCKFWLMLGTHGHWAVRVYFSVPHPLWHGASVNNGHLRGTVTLTPIAERLAVELLRLMSVDSNTQPSTCGTNAITQCATAAVINEINHFSKALLAHYYYTMWVLYILTLFARCPEVQRWLRQRNINWQYWKYTSFVIFICYSQNIRRHSAMGGD